jgi:pyruvate dehydrogenase E1 component
VGTVYDPFIARGLDALNYACYQDARFIIAGTPSGLSLAPEGGAHQSVFTPLIGIGQPSLTFFEPAYVDELTTILRWSFEHLQSEPGGSVYLRLSTRRLDQLERTLSPSLSDHIIQGGYWLREPGPEAEVALVASGAVLPDVLEAYEEIADELPGAGLLVVTSAAKLHRNWIESQRSKAPGNPPQSHAEKLLAALPSTAGLVTILDGHSATLSWLGAVQGHFVVPLGVERFGQSGNIHELYRAYGLDADAIMDAVARICVRRH